MLIDKREECIFSFKDYKRAIIIFIILKNNFKVRNNRWEYV